MVDSTEYYQNLVDRYTNTGTNMKSAGTWLMISGGAATVVGCALLANSFFFENRMSDALDGVYWGGITAIAGAGVFTTGFVVKLVGRTKLRKAHQYEEKLGSNGNPQSVALTVSPLVNPVAKSLGGALALSF